jgi:glutathione S-transferase
LDAIEEITSILGPSLREKDEQKKLEMRAVLSSTTLPNWFSMLDKYLANLGDSYSVGSSLTIADLKISVLVKWIKSGVLDGISGEIVDPFPRLVKVNELVQEDERVKAYYASKAK